MFEGEESKFDALFAEIPVGTHLLFRVKIRLMKLLDSDQIQIALLNE